MNRSHCMVFAMTLGLLSPVLHDVYASTNSGAWQWYKSLSGGLSSSEQAQVLRRELLAHGVDLDQSISERSRKTEPVTVFTNLWGPARAVAINPRGDATSTDWSKQDGAEVAVVVDPAEALTYADLLQSLAEGIRIADPWTLAANGVVVAIGEPDKIRRSILVTESRGIGIVTSSFRLPADTSAEDLVGYQVAVRTWTTEGTSWWEQVSEGTREAVRYAVSERGYFILDVRSIDVARSIASDASIRDIAVIIELDQSMEQWLPSGSRTRVPDSAPEKAGGNGPRIPWGNHHRVPLELRFLAGVWQKQGQAALSSLGIYT